MSELFEQLKPHLERAYAFQTALRAISWDNSTLAPREAIENTSKAIGILSGEEYKAQVNDEVKGLLKELEAPGEQEKLNDSERALVRKMGKGLRKLEKIPAEEYQAYSELLAKSYPVWEQAKNNNDYASFAPVLQEVISSQKRFRRYQQEEGQTLYDVALDEYEEGFTVEILDDFFGKLRTALVPLIKQIREKQELVQDGFLNQNYPIEKQKELCRFLAEYIGFDFNRGVMAESEHPFTTNFHNHDVRITNHFHEDRLDFACFSVIHEGGHALYEQGIDDGITMTPIGEGTSMGMHESQSRFYENNLGRSRAFWMPIYHKVQELFPEQLGGVGLEEFYRAINKSAPSLIRTEADELTYPFHVMIRYEIEKMIFQGEVSVEELPAVWNRKYQEYLGVSPDSDTNGILQDMHWSGGSFGYFPSYALGSAIAAQICHHIKQVMPLEEYLEAKNLAAVREYLKEHIHKYGGARNTQELLLAMTGEAFNPDYYIAYLTEKYTELYQL
ncbi:MAG: carboxypeptidase M32 [Lachnospiraceae bacterium]|nr:carboxypeptidase M32 [Lachnospiraceae bacterium]MCI9152075.1 carboxypeptidase M32 [Lachnospiraceae bacterium]